MKVNQIRWMVAFAILAVNALGAPILTVETDNPTNNMFAIGTSAAATFSVNEWTANEERQIVADVFDYRNEKVATLTASLKADENGTGSVRVTLPTDRHGFFRVRAKAGDLKLPKLGTRPAGEFTYGVTIDPKDRPDIPQERAFMGIHGEACDQGRWMGAHQGFASYAQTEEGFQKLQARNAANPWKRWGFNHVNIAPYVYDFVTWSHKGVLSPASEKFVREHKKDMTWTAFTTEEGRAFYREWIALQANAYRKYMHTPGKRIYEIFWEPDLTAPDKKTMVDAAELAAKLIKEIDPEGLVALPTISNCSHLGWHRELFELGILKYADVFDLHPYTAYPPEPNGYLQNIRALKRMLAEYGRPDIPFICTESGYQTAATQEGERLQLDGQVRVQLMLLGEGIWFNCPFYGTDYGGDRNDHAEGDYGITYNLDYPKPRFGARHISPRPAFLGLCAFSMFLDGCKAKESIECLGETVLGYVYTNEVGRATAALWDYGGTDAKVKLPVGRKEIEIADIMGNRSRVATKGGILELQLSTSPVYVFDPDLPAWDKGLKACREAAAAAGKAKEMAPVKVLAATSSFAGAEPAASVTVVNNTGAARKLTVATRIVADPEAGGKEHRVAAMSVSFDLLPHGEASVPFVLAWRYPYRTAWAKTDVGNHYATVYPSALAAARRLMDGLPDLEGKTLAFVRSVLASRAPDVVKEAALFNLSTLRTETCFRTRDGHFYGWEGITGQAGSCHGSCTHVWGYEHALIDIWPALAKDMTETQFGPALAENGRMAFRVNLPADCAWGAAAADGQMQCIVKAYENWRKTGDDAWMRRLYPNIRKAMEYAWLPNGWDGDRDGVMEGCQHNTMDVDYYGPNPQMEFLYLAALKAMADACADADFAAQCRDLAARGSAWTEKNLFNGAYYEHKVVAMKGRPADGTSIGSNKNPADPDYQLAAGCLVDQLVGDYAARHVGLGPVADEEHARTTLDTILARNRSDPESSQFNNMRDFAFPEEPALKMAWYPDGRMPKKPFPYYVENMTGFEYVVAANLAQRGDFARAEQVVRDIRDRYDGRKRNPFDEAECGHHYARALAAWSVLKAWQCETLEK